MECYEGSHTKKCQDHVPCSFDYKVVCIDHRFTKPIVVYRGENVADEFIKAILKKYKYCKKVMNKNFNKNFMSNEEEHLFQQSNSCWICKKLMNSSVDKLVKNLSDEDFKHLVEEFSSENLELLK